MSDEARIELMIQVKEGTITMNEALEQVRSIICWIYPVVVFIWPYYALSETKFSEILARFLNHFGRHEDNKYVAQTQMAGDGVRKNV